MVNERHFMILLDNSTHGKADSEALAKYKGVKGKPHKINELIVKMKAELKEGPDNK